MQILCSFPAQGSGSSALFAGFFSAGRPVPQAFLQAVRKSRFRCTLPSANTLARPFAARYARFCAECAEAGGPSGPPVPKGRASVSAGDPKPTAKPRNRESPRPRLPFFSAFFLFLQYSRGLIGFRISASYAGACASTAHRPAEGTRGSPRHGSASPESPPHTRQAHPARKGAQQIPRPSRNP